MSMISSYSVTKARPTKERIPDPGADWFGGAHLGHVVPSLEPTGYIHGVLMTIYDTSRAMILPASLARLTREKPTVR
ncbi:hypothetical protein ASPCADRAFT_202346 [Aspergillus carbonarius ITEM 5010]|uniref:Uncharacterized protein n=1 Tax=Aspergillus carbonarius (strain ITEM 5010) TaxID=602072 RepID=A0A1R3S143_ASPC5|nr:hypothetical protein ASPCADRAFT_202346 [Aspergillus carbonarius ITEM 5010]